MKLNDLKCKTAKPREKQYKLSDGFGLFLLILPSGGKYWRYKYRIDGKERLFSIGVYPETSLLEAREKHKQAHKLVKEGLDPNQVKLEDKIARQINNSNTFEALAREWLEKKKTEVKPQTHKNIQDRLEMNLFPRIGSLPLSSITPAILLDALKGVEKRGAFDMVKRLRQTSNQIFRFAIASGKANYNPAADIGEALKTKPVQHFKDMPVELLPDFMRKLDSNKERLFPQTILALRLMLFTFTRKAELSHARWCEIDFKAKLWKIPPERMKMKKEHLVPLSRQALAIFEELHQMTGDGEYVFPSMHKPRKPMHEDTMLRALYTLGYKGIATIHGFRALAMTQVMEKLGYRYEVPDLQLAHGKGNKVKAAYDRTQFLDERKQMMQDWADFIDGMRAA